MQSHRRIVLAALLLSTFATAARADLTHEWIVHLPVGAALTAGPQGMVVDAAGVSYVTGITGSSSNTDVITAAVAPGGSVLWSHVFDGPNAWHDQARGIALGPGGVVYVTGNTPNPNSYANVMLLKYDAASGALLDVVQYASQPNLSEYGASVATDVAGNVYIAGGTVGDGSDVLVLKFDANGDFQWQRIWDGPAWGPYSQDSGQELLIDPNGDPIVMLHGVMNSLHPDYVVVKYDASSGATVWEANWGVNGGDFPTDLELDAAGDIYVTGTGIDFNDKFSTIKLRGSDGQLLWQEYDAAGIDDSARALALDGQGGVYIVGAVDPDGDHSNFNDNIYAVKRDASTGAFLWSFLYGQNCIGCYDVPSDVIVDSSGRVYVSGGTSSPPYSSDMITFMLDAGTGVELDRGVISGGSTESAGARSLAFDAMENLYIDGQVQDVNTGAKQISLVKYPAQAVSWSNYCQNTPNSSGGGAVMSATGSTSVSSNAFSLTVEGAAANQLGIFYYGATETLFPFGEGWRCVGGSPFRLGPAQATNASGFASRHLDLTQAPADAGPGAIHGGSRWYFQFWFRDPLAGGTAFNLSDGLAVDFVP